MYRPAISRLSIVFMLASIFWGSSNGQPKFDIALVINSEVKGLYPTLQGTGLLREFLKSIKENTNVPVNNDLVRLAIVNTYVNNDKVAMVKVIRWLADDQSTKSIQDSIFRMEPVDKHDIQIATTTLADIIGKEVFVSEKGDRPEVPNVIFVVQIYEDSHFEEKRARNYVQSFTGCSIVLLVDNYEKPISPISGPPNFVGYVVPTYAHGEFEKVLTFSAAAAKMTEILKKYWDSCGKVTESKGKCYYTADGCICDTVFNVSHDSNPPGYCLNGSRPEPSKDEDKCKDSCAKLTVKWGKCDCKTNKETGIFTTLGDQKLHIYCPLETRPCQTKCQHPLPLSVTITIIVLVIALVIAVIVVIIVVIRNRRKKKRHRRDGKQQGRYDQKDKGRSDHGRGTAPSGTDKRGTRSQNPSRAPTIGSMGVGRGRDQGKGSPAGSVGPSRGRDQGKVSTIGGNHSRGQSKPQSRGQSKPR